MDSTREALLKVNWDFPNAHSNYGLHRLHWYPATFIPQIPAYLIELFSKENDLVYDPFCGVGTTLVESVRLGRRAIGSDLNYIACLIAGVKVTFVDPGILHHLQKMFYRKLKSLGNPCWHSSNRTHSIGYCAESIDKLRKEYRHLEDWYHEITFTELITLWKIINEFDPQFRNLLVGIFSSILKSCSSQTNHWGYVADNMKPKTKVYRGAIGLFLSTFQDFIDASSELIESQASRHLTVKELNQRALVMRSDLRLASPLKENSVDLIVTSPPYVNVTDYTTSQRLSLDWFGLDISQMKASEIGARWKRFRRGCVGDYLEGMNLCLSHLSIALKPGQFLCIVVDRSEDRRGINVVDFIKASLLDNRRFILFEEVGRSLSRQRLRQKDGTSGQELILVFRKL
jgi:DNA modification methylase